MLINKFIQYWKFAFINLHFKIKVMNNQIILSALESQLAIKKAECDSYETSTSEPSIK